MSEAARQLGEAELVFALELPLDLAPTLNEYAAKKARKWAMEKLNKSVDSLIGAAKMRWPEWDMGVHRETRPMLINGRPTFTLVRRKLRTRTVVTGGRRRLVVVTRYSSRQPDELSVDVVGGKLCVDRLVLAGVLRGDCAKWLQREARWVQVPPGAGRVTVEVYEAEQ